MPDIQHDALPNRKVWDHARASYSLQFLPGPAHPSLSAEDPSNLINISLLFPSLHVHVSTCGSELEAWVLPDVGEPMPGLLWGKRPDPEMQSSSQSMAGS